MTIKKDIFLIIITVFVMISNASATVVVNPALFTSSSRSNNSSEQTDRAKNTIIGKYYYGCKVVDAFYSLEYSEYIIICLKNGKLFKESYKVNRLSLDDCHFWACKDLSRGIPNLFEERNND